MSNQSGSRLLLKMVLGVLKALRRRFQGNANRAVRPLNPNAKTGREDTQKAYAGPPLEIGNELLITEDVARAYRGLTHSQGRVVIIDELPSHQHAAVKASAFGIQVDVNVEVAQQMRSAYILREQS